MAVPKRTTTTIIFLLVLALLSCVSMSVTAEHPNLKANLLDPTFMVPLSNLRTKTLYVELDVAPDAQVVNLLNGNERIDPDGIELEPMESMLLEITKQHIDHREDFSLVPRALWNVRTGCF